MTAARAGSSTLKVRLVPATAARWRQLTDLFGRNGACGGCWCMTWRLPRAAYAAGAGHGNRERLRRLIARKPAPGLLGLHRGRPVAWCSVAPRIAFDALSRSRVLKPIDDAPVWSISCLFVHADYRGRGLSTVMIRGAVAFAAKHGARIVEGYPYAAARRTADAFLWTGPVAAFERAGFRQVAQRSPTRPIMRAYTR